MVRKIIRSKNMSYTVQKKSLDLLVVLLLTYELIFNHPDLLTKVIFYVFCLGHILINSLIPLMKEYW